jgi:hypothetical protein
MKNKLLAPNGKPSNLNATQYELVRTSAFKKWFGDWEKDPANASKVVDENGEPLVVYHGTNYQFFSFNQNKKSHYFAVDKKYADFVIDNYRGRNENSRIISCFLNIRKLQKVKFPIETNNIAFYLNEYKNNSLKEQNGGIYGLDDLEDNHLKEIKEKKINTYVYVVLNPNQIKLADGTNTTFDSSNDDIRFEKGGRTIAQTPAPKKDQVYGSDLNKSKSSKNISSAKFIKFDDKTLEAIKNKVHEHNQEHPDKKINLSSAKAVVRRGMGAYSKSHRPTISGGKPNSRVAWGLARLNAFTYKIVNGKSKSGKYSQDDDLINELGFKVANYNNGGEMSKDIRCINCGWEWNKKDSELWDMYVCHKCGFDNTTFYTSIPINNYSRGGQTERTNPDYLKMFLGK